MMPKLIPLRCLGMVRWTVTCLLLGLTLTACGDEGHEWCSNVTPATARCSGPHCVLAVVVDYKRLDPRGYQVFSLEGEAVERSQAETLARDHLVEKLGQPEPNQTDCQRAGDFIHCGATYPENDRYLVVVSAQTGTVLFAGKEVWADEDRGYDFPVPSGFTASPRVCGAQVDAPTSRKLVVTGAPGRPDATVPLTRPEQALDTIRQLALVESFVGDASYRAMVISYAPAIGEFDAESADWYVWLYRLPQ